MCWMTCTTAWPVRSVVTRCCRDPICALITYACNVCTAVLVDARLAGLVEEYLSVLQDTFQDLRVYIAGRVEARAEIDRLSGMVRTLYDAHPLMFKQEDLEGTH